MNNHDFSRVIGYQFNNKLLLENALTHSSYVNDVKKELALNNERLEFLGDAIFDAIISELLFNRMTDVEEGRLTKLRALVVCERSLAECGNRLGIGRYLRLGRGEEHNGGRSRSSIIADAMEAVIAAIYLDGGLDAARAFVISAFGTTIESALEGKLNMDYKTQLQELLQSRGEVEILYQIDRQEGPDHSKTFYVSLMAEGIKIGEGQGQTKKEAEQNAAKAALEGKIVL